MRFFTDYEITRSIFLSIIFGLFLACIYLGAGAFFNTVKKLARLPLDVFKLSSSFSVKRLLYLSRTAPKSSEKKNVNNVYDAIIFSLFSVLFIVHLYVVLDGVFRIYVLCTVILVFLLITKTIGRFINFAFDKMLSYIHRIALLIFTLMTVPMYKMSKFFIKIIRKRIEPIKEKYFLKKSKRVVSRKIKEIKMLLETVDYFT